MVLPPQKDSTKWGRSVALQLIGKHSLRKAYCVEKMQKLISIGYYYLADRNTCNLETMGSHEFNLVFWINYFQDKGILIRHVIISNQVDLFAYLLYATSSTK